MMAKKTGVLLLALLAMGCSEASNLVGKANGSHKLMAKWSLKVYGLRGGAPDDYKIDLWENGSVFRAHVDSTTPGEGGGPTHEVSDVLCDGKTVWQFNRGDGMKNIYYEPADSDLLKPLYFWHVPDIAYNVQGSEKILGRDCTCLKTTNQDITHNNVDIFCYIDPGLGYLMKRTNKSADELYGGQSECLEVQAYPTFPAGHFDPPKEAEKSIRPPSLWGIGIQL